MDPNSRSTESDSSESTFGIDLVVTGRYLANGSPDPVNTAANIPNSAKGDALQVRITFTNEPTDAKELRNVLLSALKQYHLAEDNRPILVLIERDDVAAYTTTVLDIIWDETQTKAIAAGASNDCFIVFRSNPPCDALQEGQPFPALASANDISVKTNLTGLQRELISSAKTA